MTKAGKAKTKDRHPWRPVRCAKCGIPLGQRYMSPARRIENPDGTVAYQHTVCPKIKVRRKPQKGPRKAED